MINGPSIGSTGATTYTYTNDNGITGGKGFVSAGYNQMGEMCWRSTQSVTTPVCTSAPAPTGTNSTTANSYDGSGERTAVATTTTSGTTTNNAYGWNQVSGRLCWTTTAATAATCASNPTGPTGATSFTYDGDGLRTGSTTSGTTTTFTWDKVGQHPLSNGSWYFLYGPTGSAPVEQIATSGTTPVSDLLVADSSGNVRGVVRLTGASLVGNLTNYSNYDSYGNPMKAPNLTSNAEPGGLTTAQTGMNAHYVDTTPFGYGEGYTDASGLIYLVNRYYEPTTSQFVSVDPMLAKTGEPYQYASDNPIGLNDPTGLCDLPHTKTWIAPGKCNWKSMAWLQTVMAALHSGRTRSGWRSLANFGAGVANGLVGTVTLGFVVVHSSYKDQLPWAYGLGTGFGLVGGGLAGGELFDALRGARAGEEGGSVLLRDLFASCESFSPTTGVLLASGATTPISTIMVGDKVLATNVKTGKIEPQTVTDVMVHDDHDLANLTVNVNGQRATIMTTQHHLYWDIATGKWTETKNLVVGDRLFTPDGALATVAKYVVVPGSAWMWDLTVSNDHDFFVQLSESAVLVHNCPVVYGGQAAHFDNQELAQLIYKHIGEGDVNGRPSLQQILDTLEKGTARRIHDRNAIEIIYKRTRVIINEELPTRSTAVQIRR